MSFYHVFFGVWTGLLVAAMVPAPAQCEGTKELNLIPYPQEITRLSGSLTVGPASYVVSKPSDTTAVAVESLSSCLPKTGTPVTVRLGSVEEGYDSSWFTSDENDFLNKPTTSGDASILKIGADGITIVGKGNWTLDEWKWLVDWSLLHKCNGWAYVFCGYWPFTLPGYEESTLDVPSFYYDEKTGKKTPYRFVHRNIKKEFLPELIRYAQARGIKMYAYMAINSFDGGYQLHHPEVDAGGAAEMLPFAPGVHDYCRAFLRRMVDMGFDVFVFENPEANHVPYQNEECFKTFWEPFGYSREKAKELTNTAPLDAHLNYNAWLIHEYDGLMQERWRELGHPGKMDVFVISHVMFSRVMSESKTEQEKQAWLAKFDAVAGRKLPIITVEADEKKYVALFGPERTANLGGARRRLHVCHVPHREHQQQLVRRLYGSRLGL